MAGIGTTLGVGLDDRWRWRFILGEPAVQTLSRSWLFGSQALTVYGFKVWDGAAWVFRPLMMWDGFAWVNAKLKYWDGATWVPCTA